ncbi:MAG: cytochrome c oxidase assembly factor Coa1 family protein [Syntrophales bacterium]
MENTSGQGKQAVIPTELKGWNWGAFLMNWVWGIFNKTYIALLTFVPLIGMFMPFVLGFKGNAWAWRNKRWESIDHFRKVQRKWAMWGVIMLIFSLVASAGSVFFLFETLKSSEPYVMAVDKAQVSGEVQNIIGAPMKPGWWMVGNISTEGTGGKAEFSIPVEGSKNKGTIFVKATKTSNKWKLDQLYLLPEGGGTSIDLLKVPQPRPPSPGQVKQPPQEAPPMDTPPPDKEAMQPGKVTATPVVAAGKGVKDTVAAKKDAPAAAPVPQPGKTAVAEKKPAGAETIPAPKERLATNKPKKKYAKKSVSKGRTAASAKEKTTADPGRAEITAGDYQGAIKTLSAAIAKNPQESVNYRLRGNAYDNLGKREQAIEDWKKAAALGDRIIQSYLLFLQVEWP